VQLGLLERDVLLDETLALVHPEIDGYGGDSAFLRSGSPALRPVGGVLASVDLFAGGGGLSLGLQVAAAQHGRAFRPLGAVEMDPAAAAVYRANFTVDFFAHDVREIFAPYGTRLSLRERRLRAGGVDFVLAGPPCQGNSDLNNYTRRNDERNELYFSVARAAEVLRPRHIIVENVPGVRHDQTSVVMRTAAALRELHYDVAGIVLDAADFGVAQHRKRYFLIASRHNLSRLPGLIDAHRLAHRSLAWAIGDLAGRANQRSLLDSPGETNRTNLQRIKYLFDHDLYDLPDCVRPPCHAEKRHSYKSVYGRLHWDKPAQTVTRGFYSVCMGRYVHPSEPRSITAHEAARIQFLPDFFALTPAGSKSALAKIIGNVVPPKLAYVLGASLLLNEAIDARG
jgi:DNA (cytosine-5)-methyltransferase 1